MNGRRAARAVGSALLTGLALTACTAPGGGDPSAPSAAGPGPTPSERPVGPVVLPEGATAAVRWTDQVGAPEPQTVLLRGEPLFITVSVVCDTEDAEVTVEIDGLFSSGSACYASDGTGRSAGGGGNTATMHVPVDQEATVSVTTTPADALWSGAVSTG